jgi:hypothetical protein
MASSDLELMDPETLDGIFNNWGVSRTLSSMEEANEQRSGNDV